MGIRGISEMYVCSSVDGLSGAEPGKEDRYKSRGSLTGPWSTVVQVQSTGVNPARGATVGTGYSIPDTVPKIIHRMSIGS